VYEHGKNVLKHIRVFFVADCFVLEIKQTTFVNEHGMICNDNLL